jgi:hypothetical protein
MNEEHMRLPAIRHTPELAAPKDRVVFVVGRRGIVIHRLRATLVNGAARTACSAILPQGGEFTQGWYKIGEALLDEDGTWGEIKMILPGTEPERYPHEMCRHCLEAGKREDAWLEQNDLPLLTQAQQDAIRLRFDPTSFMPGRDPH